MFATHRTVLSDVRDNKKRDLLLRPSAYFQPKNSAMDASIRVSNHEIQCPIPGLPPCLLQLVLLQSQAFIWMGQYGGPARVGVDWSAAMPGLPSVSWLYHTYESHPRLNIRTQNPASATSTTLSRGTNSDISLSMSKRLCMDKQNQYLA